MSRRAAPLFLLAVLLIAGCGNTAPRIPPQGHPAAPAGFQQLSYRSAGIRLSVPRNWVVFSERHAALAVVSSGSAVISLWRYHRSVPISVAGTVQLTAARRALLQSALRRASTLRLLGSSVAKVDGHGAVVLDTLQRLNGRLRRVRSLHIYGPAGELVLEEYAPPAMFDRVDQSVFAPVRHSLKLLPSSAA